MMLLSLVPSLSWMARWGIAYVVGMAAGLRAYGYLNSNVIGQVKGTAVNILDFSLPIFSLSSPSIFNNIIIKNIKNKSSNFAKMSLSSKQTTESLQSNSFQEF